MTFKHTDRPGFWLGIIYMPLNGLQDELDFILGRRTQRYWIAYPIGIATKRFFYTLNQIERRMNEGDC